MVIWCISYIIRMIMIIWWHIIWWYIITLSAASISDPFEDGPFECDAAMFIGTFEDDAALIGTFGDDKFTFTFTTFTFTVRNSICISSSISSSIGNGPPINTPINRPTSIHPTTSTNNSSVQNNNCKRIYMYYNGYGERIFTSKNGKNIINKYLVKQFLSEKK
eukprot:950803_1